LIIIFFEKLLFTFKIITLCIITAQNVLLDFPRFKIFYISLYCYIRVDCRVVQSPYRMSGTKNYLASECTIYYIIILFFRRAFTYVIRIIRRRQNVDKWQWTGGSSPAPEIISCTHGYRYEIVHKRLLILL